MINLAELAQKLFYFVCSPRAMMIFLHGLVLYCFLKEKRYILKMKHGQIYAYANTHASSDK